MSFSSEFKQFALKGNVIDLAVGVIIGGAFGKIVTSFTNDVIMPPIGMLMGGVDFKNLYVAPDEDSGYSSWPLPAIRWALERGVEIGLGQLHLAIGQFLESSEHLIERVAV